MISEKHGLECLDRKLNAFPFKSTKIQINEWEGSVALQSVHEIRKSEKNDIITAGGRNISDESRLLNRLDLWINATTISRPQQQQEIFINRKTNSEKSNEAIRGTGWTSMEKLLAATFKEGYDHSSKKNSVKNFFRKKNSDTQQQIQRTESKTQERSNSISNSNKNNNNRSLRHPQKEKKSIKEKLTFFNWTRKKKISRGTKSTGDAPSPEELSNVGRDLRMRSIISREKDRSSCPPIFSSSEEIQHKYCPHSVDSSRRAIYDYRKTTADYRHSVLVDGEDNYEGEEQEEEEELGKVGRRDKCCRRPLFFLNDSNDLDIRRHSPFFFKNISIDGM